jgi:ABC-2 type transport system permease protein
MTDSAPVKREPPSDMSQLLTVIRYELLKHIRSRRLVGSIAVTMLIVVLIYAIPPALGHPYTGHMAQDMEVLIQPPAPGSYAFLNHSHPVNASIVIHVNGTLLPNTNWTYDDEMNAVIFLQDLRGKQVVADFDFKEDPTDFAETFMQFTSTLIIIFVTFFGADALTSEFQNRTAYLLFPNPLRREVMFLGKFIASFAASLCMVGLFYLVIVALSVATIGGVAQYIALSFGFSALFLMACLALSFFVSAIMKGSTGAIILTFFLLLMIIPIVQSVGMFSGMKMWFLITFIGDLSSTSLNWDHYPVDHSETVMGFTYYNYYPDPGTSVITLIAYVVIFCAMAVFLFRRRELTG